MADQQIACKDCTTEFTFTDGEAAFYKTRALMPPKRCKDCRTKRKFKSASRTPDAPATAHDNLL